ncbi:hypothetical protein M422DRAFT_54775 [Sphaerobolus stellatus SS14]|uniref:Uncharacterized protein n=1 Tax=Sphaerobolus stellatus (strain SS14) TaxID=990650 RepID=A0A0C9U1V6_SPHS4|nr:hypothetical protein M422DRAFT_54775 [Sphaerobolus stellatus SS14]
MGCVRTPDEHWMVAVAADSTPVVKAMACVLLDACTFTGNLGIRTLKPEIPVDILRISRSVAKVRKGYLLGYKCWATNAAWSKNVATINQTDQNQRKMHFFDPALEYIAHDGHMLKDDPSVSSRQEVRQFTSMKIIIHICEFSVYVHEHVVRVLLIEASV